MLYEFHRKQNAKKPGSVHATYLIAGTRKVVATTIQTNGDHSQDGEDTVMQSSPVLPSSSAVQSDGMPEESTFIRTLTLVKQEHLEKAKATLDSISSIHIYSLEANGLGDVQALTECNRKVASSYASEDPLTAWKQYGTIQNPNVKRRTTRTVPPPAAPTVKVSEAKATAATLTATSKQPSETKATPKPPSNNATPEPESKRPTKPIQNKRQNSDIFKSFAKSKTKPTNQSQSSAEASPAVETADEPMGGFSDDEADDDAPNEVGPGDKEPSGKSKKDREAELQAMMDQEDEPMEDAPTPTLESQNPIDKSEVQQEIEPKEDVTIENGRRRGRRRVMRKKTVKDEEGYLGMPFSWSRCPPGERSLTRCSHEGRSRMGIFLRGRTRCEEDQGASGAATEERSENRSERKHHVFLWEEMNKHSSHGMGREYAAC